MTRLNLAQVQATHGPVLILDAAGSCQAARCIGGHLRSSQHSGEAGVAIFRAIADLGGPEAIEKAGAFVFCRLPGSVLGARTCAMAIRLWTALRSRPVYGYHGLELMAAAHGGLGTAFVADARRGEWHWSVSGGAAERISEAELAARAATGAVALVSPAGFKAWSRPSLNVGTAPYEIGSLWQSAADCPLLTLDAEPDAVLASEPAYVRWTPQLHGEVRP
ncbi:MAG TPA: hypothetical protein VGL42_10020 [Opitutaceae bacterium]